jgi:hypothetical protein
MQDFPANSAKARSQSGPSRPDEKPTIERVTSGEAVRRKRGLGRQFKETFIAGSARMAVDFVLLEVIVPQIQEMLIDALQGGTERYIRGDSRLRRGSRTSNPYSSHPGEVNYQGMSRNRPNTTRTLSQQARSRHDFGDILIPSLREAEDVIDRMYDVLSRYGSVEVATLYSLTGIQVSHTDKKWGWTSLSGARAVRQRNGSYLLDLPAPEPLG